MKQLELKAIELEKSQVLESGFFGKGEDLEMKKTTGSGTGGTGNSSNNNQLVSTNASIRKSAVPNV